MYQQQRQALVLPELSYAIVGALFEAFNELGDGYQEKHYYRAVKSCLEKRGLKVQEQIRIPVDFQNEKIGDFFLDFLVDGKVVLELKVGGRFRKADFDQVKAYHTATRTLLALLARFNSNGVSFHRVLLPSDQECNDHIQN